MAVDNGISPFSTAGIAAVNSIAPGGFTGSASFPSGVGSDPNSTIDSSIAATAGTTSLSYPSTIPKYYVSMQISQYQRNGTNQISTSTNVQGTIILPLPSKIMDAQSISYSDTELGSLTGYLAGQAQKGWNEYKNTGDLKGALQNTGADILKTKGDALEALAMSGLGFNGSSEQQGFSSVSGYSPNQFLTVLLKGPQYKRHEMSWKVSPRNASESQSLNQIINTLNNAMAPAMSTNQLWFSFPKIFQIAFMPNSQYLYKFKPCVLEQFIVDFSAGGGPSFYRQGNDGLNAPTILELRCIFHELEFWTSGQFSLNNTPTDVENNSGGTFQDPVGNALNNAGNGGTGSGLTQENGGTAPNEF